MLIKSTYLKVLITALTLSSSAIAIADESKFKIAVVKKEFGIKDSEILAFNKHMRNCAELTKALKADESEIACNAAIASIKLVKTDSRKAKFLESLTYSNRGISRFVNNDLTGAKDDLLTAMRIDENSITESNLELINSFITDEVSFEKPTTIAD